MQIHCSAKTTDHTSGTIIHTYIQCVIHIGEFNGSTNCVLLMVNSRNPTGKIYQLQNNIITVHTTCIQEGKAAIYFLSPPDLVLIKNADPSDLRRFLSMVSGAKRNSITTDVINPATIKKPKKFNKKKVIVINNSDSSTYSLEPTTLTLKLSCNWKILDDRVLKMNMLRELVLNGNKLKTLPLELGNLPLQLLHLDGNKLSDTNFIWLEQPAIRRNLSDFSISGNKLTTFPLALVDFKKLVRLNVSDNYLKSLPSRLARLPSLSELDISENQIRNLPISFKNACLRKITLSSDMLATPFFVLRPRSFPSPYLPSLKALAAVAVCIKLKNSDSLTYEDCPWTLLNEVRSLSECICGKRVSPLKSLINYAPLVLLRAETVIVVNSCVTTPIMIREIRGEYHNCCIAHRIPDP